MIKLVYFILGYAFIITIYTIHSISIITVIDIKAEYIMLMLLTSDTKFVYFTSFIADDELQRSIVELLVSGLPFAFNKIFEAF